MLKRVIINSDDFGMTEGVTIGTLRSHTDGVLTSTTCMMNMPFAKFALEQAKKHPKLGVGIHLVLTMGRPLVDGAKSFTDEQGNFRKLNSYPDKKPTVDLNELYIEWKEQIEKFIRIAGKKPTHIDSHHHAHLLPQHHEVVVKLAREYDIPLRQKVKMIDTYEFTTFSYNFYGENVTPEALINELKCEEKVIEIMCHPAYIDQALHDASSYSLERIKEMETLRSKEVRNYIEQNNIELITYADLKKL